MSATRPTTGGRFVARRSALSDGIVSYEVELMTAEAHWTGAARIQLAEGEVSLEVSCLEETNKVPPAWLTAHLVAALRSAWRGIETPASAQLTDFPRRLTRWRSPLPGKESTPP